MALYDAFISYSHAKDKAVASALQSAVQRRCYGLVLGMAVGDEGVVERHDEAPEWCAISLLP